MNSIRTRLLVSLVLTLLLAALVLGGITYRNALQEAEGLFDYQLRQMALSLRDQGEIAPDQANAFADAGLDFVVQIWTVDGRAIYSTRAHAALPARAVLGFADVAVQGQTWRTFSVAARDRVIQVAQPRQIRERLAAGAALRSVLPLLLMLPLLAVVMSWLVAVTLRPLRQVSQQVTERGAEALSPLPAEGLPDEVAPLVGSLNALLQRLSAAFDAQRAFVADAAHELRSPLTALKLQVQMLRRAADPADRAAATEALAQGVERASRLVEQLLTLARNEPGARQAPLQPVDLAEAVRQALADAGPLAAERGTTLALEAAGPVQVQGDAIALAALARNLADNAVRYAPPGARVLAQVANEGDAAVLTVDDSGPGIPSAERERVFDRFWRREATAASTAGTGLGMAIVKSVAERHGAQVSLGDSPLGGLRVTVRFPRAA
ncbi:ATP-binding protein [Ideonella sp. BN130291]|uniref:ATP-binding protein n=1 Tax=Ideonella sp. BN130291 TaxID=3112940 RepID=UPI002E259B9A|nr:ATP-binding protein [Ideonella sp. BN130291]